MKEVKEVKIEIRLTPQEKAMLKEYCQKNKTTMSEVVRDLINKILGGWQNDKV